MKSLQTILAALTLAALPASAFTATGTQGQGIQSADRSPFLNALGGTTAGKALFQLANPGAITFLRVNADNSVSALNATDFKTAIGATSSAWGAITGTLASQTDLNSALALKAPLVSPALTGTPTLNGTPLGTAATLNTGTTSGTIPLLSTGGALPVVNGGTGATTTAAARGSFGITSNVESTARITTWTPASVIALLGDSITGQHDTYTSIYNRYTAQKSFYNWANIFLFGRMTWQDNALRGTGDYSAAQGANFGVGGNSSAQIRARVPDVTATACDTVLVMSGANDLGTLTSEQIATNVTGTWDDIVAGGKQVIACEILPLTDTAKSAKREKANALLRVAADARNIPIMKWPRVASNELTMGAGYANPRMFTIAGGVSGTRNDVGVHPGNIGAIRIAEILAPQLDPWIQTTSFAVPASGDAKWRTLNPYMTGTSGAGGSILPSNYSCSAISSGLTPTTSKEEWTAGIVGTEMNVMWTKVVVAPQAMTAGVVLSTYQVAPTHGLIAGDTIRPICRIMVPEGQNNWQHITLSQTSSGGSLTTSNSNGDGGSDQRTAVTDGTLGRPVYGLMIGPNVTVDAAAAANTLTVTITANGYGTFYVAQMGVIKTN